MTVKTHPDTPPAPDTIEQLAVNTIRTLSMDAVQAANSGHPGTPMALAPVAYKLWRDYLRFDPELPVWANRDRFVLSVGHASALLYSMLHLQVNVGDIRTTDDGAAVIYMNGKGGKERSMPIEAGLLSVIETYLRSRAARFPVLPSGRRMSRAQAYRNGPHGRRSSSAAMANGTLQSRIKRAFRRAGQLRSRFRVR